MPVPNLIIYALVGPRGRVRYVGKSSVGLKRPVSHARLDSREDTYKARWVKSLLRRGLMFKIRILESLKDETLLDAAERRWIAHFREIYGRALTNRTEGGTGGRMPPDICAAHSTRMKGRRPPIAGKKHSKEARIRMSKAAKERWCNMSEEEKRARQSNASRKRWEDPEQRAAARARMNRFTPEELSEMGVRAANARWNK